MVSLMFFKSNFFEVIKQEFKGFILFSNFMAIIIPFKYVS